MNRRSIALTLATLSLLALPLPARAGKSKGNEVHSSFYDAKRFSMTREAFDRAEARLRRVHVGVSELKFLELMEMEVLAKSGKPVDARIDGYLAERSKEVNARSDKDRRALVFGYVEGVREVPLATVVLRQHRVEEVRFAEAVIAGASTPEDGPRAGAETAR